MILVEDPLAVLIDRWRQQGIELLPGEPPDAVIAAFERIGVRPTPDVIELYGRLGGMGEMDDEYWRLWPLKEVANDQTIPVSEFGVEFSDYLINCWNYRLRPNISGGSAVYVGYAKDRPPYQIAPGLDAFFAAYLVNADALLLRPA